MILITALFTKDSGEPATGLTLTDIEVTLYSRAKSDGSITTIWNAVNPTDEIGGGLYARKYTGEDMNTNTYHAFAEYTGATALDTNFSVQNEPSECSCDQSGPGDTSVTYTLTDSATGDPIPDATIWVTTDVAGTNIVATDVTDDAGQVTFYLDEGVTYYVFRAKAGWSFTNPDTEVA